MALDYSKYAKGITAIMPPADAQQDDFITMAIVEKSETDFLLKLLFISSFIFILLLVV